MALNLIDTAYSYLLDKKAVPLRKLSQQARVPFSAIYAFLQGNPAQRIKDIENLTDVDETVKTALKAKIFMMYA